MARVQPEDDGGVYGLAPEPPLAVSSATACTTTLTDDKREAIQAYLAKLGPALRDKYGRRADYTPAQVRDTALERALRIDYLCWAYVLHCSAPDFEAIHAAAGEVCDYVAMRSVVGLAFFNGDAGFSTPAVVDAIVSGTGHAVASGATEAVGWLGSVDWSGLLDWS